MMQIFSQRDPRWAKYALGTSKLTMGRFGCTTTCVSMLATYFGDNILPGNMSRKIKYTDTGLVIWSSCVFPKFEFWFRENGRKEVNIKNALADPDLAVMIQVAKGSHWVVVTGYDAKLGVFKIADPWTGDRSTMKRYGDDITGAAYFRRRK